MIEILQVFLRLGCLGFGGPVATMAMMEEETVRRRGWLTAEQYAEIYAVCKLLPGPVSTQMAIYLGKIRAGRWGGLVSGVTFVFPSFLLVLGFSYFYLQAGLGQRTSPGVNALFGGLQAGALAVILTSTLQLAKPYRKEIHAWIVAVASSILIFKLSRWEPLVILGFGLIGAFRTHVQLPNKLPAFFGLPSTAWILSGAGASTSFMTVLGQLFWTCFKAGAFVFGTGLAVVPMLEGDVVKHFGWLTHSQFMDGLAVGQITPGPVVITVTFIGYKVAGLIGAIVATTGIFLPPFINVLFLVPLIWSKWSGTPSARGFASWAIPSVIGGIIGTSLKLGILVVNTPILISVFGVATLASFLLRIPAWALIPLAGGAATLLSFLHLA